MQNSPFAVAADTQFSLERATSGSKTSPWRCGFAAMWLFLALPLAALLPHQSAASSLLPLYSFTGGADGGDATGGVIADAAGVLYGETRNGGATGCSMSRSGCGTVYSFDPATGAFKVLANFLGVNGAFGGNPLLLSDSILYGTTTGGGTNKDGVVFSVHTDGTAFRILHQFSGADGLVPSGSLQFGMGGVLYGITEYGGASNHGLLYSIKPDGTFSILHQFTGRADGSLPRTLLVATSGALIGSTIQGGSNIYPACRLGCGNIFEFVPAANKFLVVYTFTNDGNGGLIGSIGAGPTIYGNDGVAPYSLDAQNGLVDIGCFSSSCVVDGGSFGASGPLLAPDGTLIGVNGITGFIFGSLYSANPATGILSILASFGGTVGVAPIAQPILKPSGNIIGTTAQGALCSTCGTIWQYTP